MVAADGCQREDSIDLNHRPLKITWVVLQGDPAKIKITPRNESGSIAEIIVQYPERRTGAAGFRALESNRVEVGVFANNSLLFVNGVRHLVQPRQ